MKLKQKSLVISLSILGLLLNGCAAKPPVFQIPTVVIPAKPEIPTVDFVIVGNKMCVDKEEAQKLYERDRLLKADSTLLRKIIADVNVRFGF